MGIRFITCLNHLGSLLLYRAYLGKIFLYPSHVTGAFFSQPGAIGHSNIATRLQELVPIAQTIEETDNEDGAFRPYQVERICRKRKVVHRGLQGMDAISQSLRHTPPMNTLYHLRQQIDRQYIGIILLCKDKCLASRSTANVGDANFPIEVGYQACGKPCLPVAAWSLSVQSLEEVGYHGEVEVFYHFVFFIFHCLSNLRYKRILMHLTLSESRFPSTNLLVLLSPGH